MHFQSFRLTRGSGGITVAITPLLHQFIDHVATRGLCQWLYLRFDLDIRRLSKKWVPRELVSDMYSRIGRLESTEQRLSLLLLGQQEIAQSLCRHLRFRRNALPLLNGE